MLDLYRCLPSVHGEAQTISDDGRPANIDEESPSHRVRVVESRASLDAVAAQQIPLAVGAGTQANRGSALVRRKANGCREAVEAEH